MVHLNSVLHIIYFIYFKQQQFNDKNTNIANFSIIPFDIYTYDKCFVSIVLDIGSWTCSHNNNARNPFLELMM